MVFFPELTISFYNLWIFSAIFLVINFGTLLMFPKYNVGPYIKTPGIKFITPSNYILYYGFFIFSIFIPVSSKGISFYTGLGIFILGLFLYTASVFSFAVSEYNKPIINRMYKFSRHPVYVSFFILMIGISIVSETYIMILIAVAHFLTTLFIIKKEEEMCENKFGKDYTEYKKKVRKII